MIDQAESYLTVPQHKFDGDPFALNCANGILNLRTGALEPPDREKYCRKLAPVNYDPEAPTPKYWLEFLNKIFDGDTDLITFIQQALGYSLTGDVGSQCLFFLHGTGANGKSTFIETVADLMGDYHYKTSAELLMATKNPGRGGDASPDVASLQACRMVTASELDSGRRFSESKIKDLTGGDTIKARRLFCPEFNFRPTHKLWIFGNNKPTIRDTDTGIWRRIRLIPFNVTIPEAERQQHFREQYLVPELPGILKWAAQGCQDWLQAGHLTTPDSVLAATTGFKDEMDLLAAFIMEKCKCAEYYSCRAGSLYDAYKKWAETSGENVLSGTYFGRELGKRGYNKKHTASGTFYYGISTIDESDYIAQPEPEPRDILSEL
jgi:putative DNA primase/helicase